MSCLFNSLAPAVGIHPDVLRKVIAEYLKTDPKLLDCIKATDIIKWTDGQTLEAYTDRMSNTDSWGGAIEIRTFCELYSMDVTVHVLYTGKEFTTESSKDPIRIVHISYTGDHFEPKYIEILSYPTLFGYEYFVY